MKARERGREATSGDGGLSSAMAQLRAFARTVTEIVVAYPE
jgi:hypothetical protein